MSHSKKSHCTGGGDANIENEPNVHAGLMFRSEPAMGRREEKAKPSYSVMATRG
jgi:hypothetical protein